MGTAITIFVVLSISVFVFRVGAVTPRISGLSDSSAKATTSFFEAQS